MSSDFKRILDNLKEKFVRLNDYIGSTFKENVESWISNSDDEIDIRFESIRIEFEKFQENLEKICDEKATSIKFPLFDAKKFEKTPRQKLEKLLLRCHNYNEMKYFDITKGHVSIDINKMGIIGNSFKYRRIKSTQKYLINTVDVVPFKNNKIIITDRSSKIKLLTDDGKFEDIDLNKTIGLGTVRYRDARIPSIQTATIACINHLNHLIVFDSAQKMFYIFDEEFKYKWRHSFENQIVTHMQNDNHEPFLLHTLSGAHSMAIHTFDAQKGLSEKKKNSMAIRNIFVQSDMVYGIPASFGIIHVLEKKKYQPVNSFQLKNIKNLLGIYVDDNDNIWTTGYKVYDRKKLSDFRYLFIVNSNGVIVKEFYLSPHAAINDFKVNENKLILNCSSSVVVMELS